MFTCATAMSEELMLTLLFVIVLLPEVGNVANVGPRKLKLKFRNWHTADDFSE